MMIMMMKENELFSQWNVRVKTRKHIITKMHFTSSVKLVNYSTVNGGTCVYIEDICMLYQKRIEMKDSIPMRKSCRFAVISWAALFTLISSSTYSSVHMPQYAMHLHPASKYIVNNKDGIRATTRPNLLHCWHGVFLENMCVYVA